MKLRTTSLIVIITFVFSALSAKASVAEVRDALGPGFSNVTGVPLFNETSFPPSLSSSNTYYQFDGDANNNSQITIAVNYYLYIPVSEAGTLNTALEINRAFINSAPFNTHINNLEFELQRLDNGVLNTVNLINKNFNPVTTVTVIEEANGINVTPGDYVLRIRVLTLNGAQHNFTAAANFIPKPNTGKTPFTPIFNPRPTKPSIPGGSIFIQPTNPTGGGTTITPSPNPTIPGGTTTTGGGTTSPSPAPTTIPTGGGTTTTGGGTTTPTGSGTTTPTGSGTTITPTGSGTTITPTGSGTTTSPTNNGGTTTPTGSGTTTVASPAGNTGGSTIQNPPGNTTGDTTIIINNSNDDEDASSQVATFNIVDFNNSLDIQLVVIPGTRKAKLRIAKTASSIGDFSDLDEIKLKLSKKAFRIKKDAVSLDGFKAKVNRKKGRIKLNKIQSSNADAIEIDGKLSKRALRKLFKGKTLKFGKRKLNISSSGGDVKAVSRINVLESDIDVPVSIF